VWSVRFALSWELLVGGLIGEGASLHDPRLAKLTLPAAWVTAMKRPQFGVRMMLLVVALIAVVIGWRLQAYKLWRLENVKILSLESSIRHYETQRDFLISNGFDTAKVIDDKLQNLRQELKATDRLIP
jgi:hypothetical protein